MTSDNGVRVGASMAWSDGWPETWVMDGHNDLAWAMRELATYDLDSVDLATGVAELQTDLPRLRRGGVGAQFWSVYVPCAFTGPAAVAATHEQIDFVERLVARHPSRLAMARSAAEVEAVAATGRTASLLGMEGGHCIDGSLAVLATMYDRGVRYLTLTHNENVPWADSATDEPAAGGLTAAGRDVVAELNRLGMFVDLSHVSPATMGDALDATRAPVIFSHSSARALCNVPRNVPDDVLARLDANGGVCMVTFVAGFVSQPVADWYAAVLDLVDAVGGDRRRLADVGPVAAAHRVAHPPPECAVGDVADHVEHVRDVAGLAQVGLGGDYDGTDTLPVGLEDVSCYPALLAELRDRRWSEAELVSLTHGNVLRAMRDMESAR